MSPPLICAKVERVATILAGADQINNGFGPSGRLAERGTLKGNQAAAEMRGCSGTIALRSAAGRRNPNCKLAHVVLFGYDSARHALPLTGGQGPRDPREWSAGDPSGVLPGASSEHRTDLTRTPRGPRGLRPEPPSIWGVPDPVRRHL